MIQDDFCDACRTDKITEIMKYISCGLDIHVNGGDAMSNAIIYQKIRIVKILLDNGFNVRADDKYMYFACSDSGANIEIVKLLVQYGANAGDKNCAALMTAAWAGNLNILKYFESIGIDLYSRKNILINCARRSNNLEIIKYLESLNNPPNRERSTAMTAVTFFKIELCFF